MASSLPSVRPEPVEGFAGSLRQAQREWKRKARACAVLLSISFAAYGADSSIRARDLGIPFRGEPGALNAITDVAGVEVGHTTLIEGHGALKVGKGPVRTGVTVVHPRGRASTTPVFGAWSTLNAAGEMTGTVWLEERGVLDGPIAITNTHSVGVVRDALVEWVVAKAGHRTGTRPSSRKRGTAC